VDIAMPSATTDTSKPTKKNGAPLKNATGRVPYHEVDRLLVFGELVQGPDGEPPFQVYPSFRAIARRYGVNHSVQGHRRPRTTSASAAATYSEMASFSAGW
jgi:hypothetical protein